MSLPLAESMPVSPCSELSMMSSAMDAESVGLVSVQLVERKRAQVMINLVISVEYMCHPLRSFYKSGGVRDALCVVADYQNRNLPHGLVDNGSTNDAFALPLFRTNQPDGDPSTCIQSCK